MELDELPKKNSTMSKKKKSPERLLTEIVFFVLFYLIKCQNACLVIHFSTNQMQIKSDEKYVGGVSSKSFSLRWALIF